MEESYPGRIVFPEDGSDNSDKNDSDKCNCRDYCNILTISLCLGPCMVLVWFIISVVECAEKKCHGEYLSGVIITPFFVLFYIWIFFKICNTGRNRRGLRRIHAIFPADRTQTLAALDHSFILIPPLTKIVVDYSHPIPCRA